MSNIQAEIMLLLDRHVEGEHLTWDHYNKLINLLMVDSRTNEEKLKQYIIKQENDIQTLKETVCLLSLKGQTKLERQPLRKRYRVA